jgi:hypothetical protein
VVTIDTREPQMDFGKFQSGVDALRANHEPLWTNPNYKPRAMRTRRTRQSIQRIVHDHWLKPHTTMRLSEDKELITTHMDPHWTDLMEREPPDKDETICPQMRRQDITKLRVSRLAQLVGYRKSPDARRHMKRLVRKLTLTAMKLKELGHISYYKVD